MSERTDRKKRLRVAIERLRDVDAAYAERIEQELDHALDVTAWQEDWRPFYAELDRLAELAEEALDG